MEQIRRGQPSGPAHLETAELAVEDHGRAVTTNPRAAAWYRLAQQAVDHGPATEALRLAVGTDPAFCLAVADLNVITEAPTGPVRGHLTNWERHHIEVVSTAAAGNLTRAADLLREHLASVGCDPLALCIVLHLRRPTEYGKGFEDLAGRLPGCHPAWRKIT